MPELPSGPTYTSYWVKPGQLLAGDHPGSRYETKARLTIGKLLEVGVSVFVDLTENGEYFDYERVANREASTFHRSIACYRFPIKDNSVPTSEEMFNLLNLLDTVVSTGKTVYLHCLHGRGRTGTVVGCYLVRHGMSGEEALNEITRLRKGTLDEGKRSPQHQEQIEMVKNWQG